MNSQTNSSQRLASVSELKQNTSNQYSLCCYTNTTPYIQVIRLVNISHTNWQRVIFPSERVLFETESGCNLEILMNQEVASWIDCKSLLVKSAT